MQHKDQNSPFAYLKLNIYCNLSEAFVWYMKKHMIVMVTDLYSSKTTTYVVPLNEKDLNDYAKIILSTKASSISLKE